MAPELDHIALEATQSARVRWLVAALIQADVGPVLVCPGSRSTPLVQALAEVCPAQMWPVLDERAAGFAALGLARAGRKPVVVTTSGSAVAHLLPALVEAGETALQLIALTADRPQLVRGKGAPQAIFQPGLLAPYATCVDLNAATGHGFANDLARVIGLLAAPSGASLHCNVCLDLPLALLPPAPLPGLPVPTQPEASLWPAVGALLPIPPPQRGERVLVIAGPKSSVDNTLDLLGSWSHVLIAAEAASGCPATCSLRGHDTWLRDPELFQALKLDRVVRIGHWPVAKGLQLVLEAAARAGLPVDVVLPGRPSDPLGQNRVQSALPAVDALAGWQNVQGGDPDWVAKWRALDQASSAAASQALQHLDSDLPEQMVHEWQLLPAMLRALPSNARLLVGNSMPIRDLDAVWPPASLPADWPEVHVHRGANGIDGTLAAGVGLALADPQRPVWVYLGDSAFLHDVGSLALLARQDLPRAPMTVVVADNGGGRIFDYLPAAQAVEPDVHTRFFTVPHGQSLAQIAAGFGLEVHVVTTVRDGLHALGAAEPLGCRVLVWQIDAAVSKQAHALRQRTSLEAARAWVAR